ncbi:MAG TPA: helix-turn-helix domain-containing protein [Stellaceae bacterium]|nr:helix-turn-helix domain-containing protein [Stellaceae bacterium]
MSLDRVDVAEIRRRLMLSQGAFARRYGVPLPTLRNWERGKRRPDATARAYLTVIARDAGRVALVYAGAPAAALTRLAIRELRLALDTADREAGAFISPDRP